ncbi:MAG: glucuronate isomerase [Bryobacterales bacterium]|nr:glucuronate isomerase [Bryobacterales bacterium]
MPFIHEDFLLQTEQAKRLYHGYAEDQPILDYHCHLPPADVASNRQFRNLFEIWLEGDHYKWRAMRANGVGEAWCTGEADPHEKFMAWAKTMPHTLRNPLYHWSHLELKRYFGFDGLLDESNAGEVWRSCNDLLTTDSLRVFGILRKFDVRALCTTDDPTDSLAHHREIAASDLETKVYPAFRPDKALAVDRPDAFNAWVARLEQAADCEIRSFSHFMDALEQRHEFFDKMGCRLSDHGLDHALSNFPPESSAASIFGAARRGTAATPEQRAQFAAHMMLRFGQLDAAKGWTKQMHLGARRNNNSRGFRAAGPDTGFDSIGDWPQVDSLGRYLDRLDREDALPRLILYNNNPNDNYTFATMLGNFQDGRLPGKMQFGSGWWYLDQKEAMEWQLNCLSNVGLLSRFVGMLTDSRSFMSYPRHEYFRRVLCNLLGNDMANGELPDDEALVGDLVQRLCFRNVRDYLRLAGV